MPGHYGDKKKKDPCEKKKELRKNEPKPSQDGPSKTAAES